MPARSETVTSAKEAKIHQLSDGILYEWAITFVDEHGDLLGDKQVGHQLNGMLAHSRSWERLTGFVRHQKERTWQGKKEFYGTFYTNLDLQLNELVALAKEHFVEDGLIKRETQALVNIYAGMLGREFIQHLVAELMWRKEVERS